MKMQYAPCIQDTLSSRAALGLSAVQPLGRVRRASKGHIIALLTLDGQLILMDKFDLI